MKATIRYFHHAVYSSMFAPNSYVQRLLALLHASKHKEGKENVRTTVLRKSQVHVVVGQELREEARACN